MSYKENNLILFFSKYLLSTSSGLAHLETISWDKINWEYFSERAIDTMLFPIVYTNIKENKVFVDKTPCEVLELFKRAQSQVLIKNAVLLNNFYEIIQKLNLAEIDVIPLKGIYLVEHYYSNIAQRQISDIDLLIRGERLEDTIQLFLDLGYKLEMYMPSVAAEISKTPAPIKFSKNEIVIDLHIGLTYLYDSCQIDIVELWKRSSVIFTDNNTRISIMNPMDLVVYLVLHLKKHFDYRNCKLISFYDIILVIAKEGLTFDDLINHSRLIGCEQNMIEIAYLLEKYFDFTIPNCDLKDSYPSGSHIEGIFLEILSRSRKSLEKKYAPAGSTGFKVLAHLSFRNKLRYVWSRTFPDRRFLYCIYGHQSSNKLSLYLHHFRAIISRI